MEAKDYLKSIKIWLGTKVADMNAPENYFELEHLLEEYHQAKLKLLGITDVVGQSEQFTAEQVVRQLNEEEHLDDAIMYYKQKIKP